MQIFVIFGHGAHIVHSSVYHFAPHVWAYIHVGFTWPERNSSLWALRFLQWCSWGFRSSGMWHCIEIKRSQHLGGMYCLYLQGPVGRRRMVCAPASCNRCDVLPMLHIILWINITFRTQNKMWHWIVLIVYLLRLCRKLHSFYSESHPCLLNRYCKECSHVGWQFFRNTDRICKIIAVATAIEVWTKWVLLPYVCWLGYILQTVEV